MRKMWIEFFRSRSADRQSMEWRWRARHSNGNIMATGAEGYARKIDCEAGFKSVARHLRWGAYKVISE